MSTLVGFLVVNYLVGFLLSLLPEALMESLGVVICFTLFCLFLQGLVGG
jgi:hypothetical protein